MEDASGSSVRGGAPDGDGSSTRCETQENERRYHKVRFLLPHETIPSMSQIRKSTAYDGDRIE